MAVRILDSDGVAVPSQPSVLATGQPAVGTGATAFETFWTSPYAGDFYIEVTATIGTVAAIRPYLLTVYRANGGVIISILDVLRPLNYIFKFLQDIPSTTLKLFNTNGEANIDLYL